jgi:hypothetical protein
VSRTRLSEALRNPLNRPQLVAWIVRACGVAVIVVALTAGLTSDEGWWLVVGVIAVGIVVAWVFLRVLF